MLIKHQNPITFIPSFVSIHAHRAKTHNTDEQNSQGEGGALLLVSQTSQAIRTQASSNITPWTSAEKQGRLAEAGGALFLPTSRKSPCEGRVVLQLPGLHDGFPLTQCSSQSKTESKIFGVGTSLVVQWLRIRLPMQGRWVQALVQEDPTCHRATKSVRHNY